MWFPSQWQKENRTETETAEIEISRVQNHKNKDRNEEIFKLAKKIKQDFYTGNNFQKVTGKWDLLLKKMKLLKVLTL